LRDSRGQTFNNLEPVEVSEIQLTKAEKAEYYDKWRALRDDFHKTYEMLLPPVTNKERTEAEMLRLILRRMREMEQNIR